MPEILLRFAAGGDVASEIIEWWGGNIGWSHIDAVLPPSDPQPGWLLGARSDHVAGIPAGVQVRPPDYGQFDRVEFVSIACSADQAEGFYRRLRGEIGKPYSFKTIFGFALDRDFKDEAGWICDELVAWACFAEGILPPELVRDLRQLTPNSLYLVCVTAARLRTA